MEVVVLILKIYLVFTVCIMLIYSVRHFTFTLNRLFSEQRAYYQDIIDSELKDLTVIVPWGDLETTEKVLSNDNDIAALIITPIFHELYKTVEGARRSAQLRAQAPSGLAARRRASDHWRRSSGLCMAATAAGRDMRPRSSTYRPSNQRGTSAAVCGRTALMILAMTMLLSFAPAG